VKKIVVVAGLILLVVLALLAVMIVFLGENEPQNMQSGYYLKALNGIESRIFMVSTTSTFTLTNQTYTSTDGKQAAKGCLYTINVTLRNDYSSDNPPPSTGTPTAPIDGTAYIFLQANLVNYDVVYPSINMSPSDFTPPRTDQTGVVLASGQTATIQLILATNETTTAKYIITLDSVSDSIPS
jgi:hypothetical protein